MTRARRLRIGALLLVAAGHLVASLFAVVPGYLSIDEATYHLMAKSWSESGGLEVWNGYREMPSPELVAASLAVHDGRLVGRPPALYPALAAPFYRLAGYRGLFALNAVAFAGAAALLYLLAGRLFGDVDLALDAVLVLILASFAWEYSQAAWTHATALLFTLGAFTLAVGALLEERSGRRAAALAGAAGLVAGLAIGIRLDAVLLLGTVLLLFLLRSPWQPRRALATLAGAAPALLLLAEINRRRFGIFSPLSMGREVGLGELDRYLPLAALGAVLLAAVWGLTRQPVRRWLARRRAAPLVAAGLVLLALAVPASRRLLAREARGAYTLGIDLRALDLERREPAMLRSDNRAVVYIGGIKKALLQSCPYLVLLLLPALAIARRHDGAYGGSGGEAGRLALLLAVPLAYFGFYAQFSWHGGLSLNLRYLVPILPYTSILVAWALRRPEARPARRRDALFAGVAAAALFAGAAAASEGIPGDELLVQTLPMALAGALLVALLLALRRRGPGGSPPAGAPRAAAALAAATLTWAGLTAFAYDLPLARETRRFNLETGRRALELVPADSLFFAQFVDPFFLLIERGRVRIARPGLDHYRDMPRLADHHLAAGRGVYGAFPEPVWQALTQGPLAGFALHPVWRTELFVLARIERGAAPAGLGPGAARDAARPELALTRRGHAH